MTAQEKFLIEHNKLSSASLQATMVLLDQFKAEAKVSLFKDNEWSLDKLRRPFIMWLTGLPSVKKNGSKDPIKSNDNHQFNIYPYDYNES